MQAWRRSFVNAAEASVTLLVKKYPESFSSKETTADIMEYYLSKTTDGKTMVYQWREVDPESGKKKVAPLPRLITTYVFSRVFSARLSLAEHLAQHISQDSRILWPTLMKSSPPALSYLRRKRQVPFIILSFNLISLAQVQHVLEQWTTGEYIKGTKQFSAENYGNKEAIVMEVDPNTKRKIHKRIVEYRTTLFTDTIEAKFDNKIWSTILDEARKLAQRETTKAVKNQKAARGKELEIIEEPRAKFVAASDSE